MKLFLIFIFTFVLLNIQFLLSRYISIYEIQPIPLLILSIYFILKADEQHLMPALLLLGTLMDCFYGKRVGPYLVILLLSGFLFRDMRNVLFGDHLLTHLISVCCLTLIASFIVYAVGGVVAFRAPIILTIYNVALTPFLFFLFKVLRVENLVKEQEHV